jgi:glycosyltransferase involved in cell wall biosynthesis
VVTPGAAWAINRDDRLLHELPTDLRVIRTRSFESRPSQSSAHVNATKPPSITPLRAQLGHLKRFPDAHIGWLPFALAAARRQAYDVAYSSSGPFTAHLVGLLLKRLTRRPWVAELRDGWYRWNRAIFPDYSRWRDGLERRLESAVMHAADRVVLVTERMADAFRAQYADIPPERFGVVSNGFDRAQFPPAAAARPSDHFDVLHTGALYYGRSLAAFLDAAQRLVQADASFASQFRLTLVGTLDIAAQLELRDHPLGERIRIEGQVNHQVAIERMQSANALLLVANTTAGAEATVPGKLFEYLAVGRPILAIAPPASSTEDVLAQTGGGWLAPAGDPAAIACVLERAFADHQAQRVPPADPRQVARFDRRALAGDLARILDEAQACAARRV